MIKTVTQISPLLSCIPIWLKQRRYTIPTGKVITCQIKHQWLTCVCVFLCVFLRLCVVQSDKHKDRELKSEVNAEIKSKAAGQKSRIERQCQLPAVIRKCWNMLRCEVSAGGRQRAAVIIWSIYYVYFFVRQSCTLVSDDSCNAHYVVW